MCLYSSFTHLSTSRVFLCSGINNVVVLEANVKEAHSKKKRSTDETVND